MNGLSAKAILGSMSHGVDNQNSDSDASSDKKQYDAYVNQVARGAGVSTLGQGVGRLLTFATQVALARMYGPAQLGIYALGVTTVWLTNVLAQFGMDNGVVRYVARFRADDDAARVRGTILLALWSTFVLSMVIACSLFLIADFLAERVFDEPFLGPAFRMFSVSLPLFTLLNMVVYVLGGFQTSGGAHRYGTSVRQIWQPLANLVLIAVSYSLGAQVVGAAAAYAISMGASAILALYYLRRVFPALLDRKAPAKFEPRALFSASAPMVVSNVMPYISTWTAVTVLGAMGTTTDVGIYNAAARTGTLSALVLFGFSGIFSPMASALYKKDSLEHLGRLYQDVSRWAFTGSLAVFLLTALLPEDVMAVFGKEFVPGWTALITIAAAQLFSSSVGLTARLLAMTGHQKVVVVATVGSTVVGVAVTIALVPSYGFQGAAAATAAAVVSSNIITLLSVRRFMGFWPYDNRYLRPLAAGILAVSGAYALKLALPLPAGIPNILVLTPVFLAGYFALLFAFGLSPSDRQLLDTLRAAARRKTGLGPSSPDRPPPENPQRGK